MFKKIMWFMANCFVLFIIWFVCLIVSFAISSTISPEINSIVVLVLSIIMTVLIRKYIHYKYEQKRQRLEQQEQEKLELQQQLIEEFEDGLKEISVDISLPKDELAYFTIGNIDWYEHRKVTTAISYAGVSQRIRIAKGMSFKIGAIAPMRQTENVHQIIESGTLYFTNKKILLVGASGSKNIPLSKILNVIYYSNGIEIQRSTGKNVCFQMDYANSLRAKIILDNLIQ